MIITEPELTRLIAAADRLSKVADTITYDNVDDPDWCAEAENAHYEYESARLALMDQIGG